MEHVFGIDLGGTKIEGVVLPRGSAEPIARLRIATEAHLGYDHIVSRIADLVSDLISRSGAPAPKQIGIGTPGTTEPPTGLLKNSNTVCLNGKPLRSDLAAALGCEVVTANDANCFALAEAALGAGVGAPTLFGIILGTGVGGGLVVRGQALEGLQGIAGEWGHNVLERDGEPCYCGKRGCVETVLSGPSLERFYRSQGGAPLPLPEILQRARSGGDPIAEGTLDRLCEKFGQALAVVINVFDPHAVVLGGGVGQVPELRTQGAEFAARWVFNDRLETPILTPRLGDSAGVFGAAMLVS